MGCSSQNRQWSQQRMAVNATAICDSPSDRFRRRSSRTTTGRCRSWTKTSQDENMPISSKTQGDRTPKTPVTARRARVGGLCGFRSPAERVPIQQQKTGRCADVREHCGHGKRRKRTAAGGFRQREKPQAAKQDKAAGSCAPPQRSQLPAVRAVSGIYEGVPKAAKNSPGALQNEKSPPFQGKQRGSDEKHEVNTEKW